VRRALEHDRQHLQTLRAQDDVDDLPVRIREERLPLLLRNASGNRDERIASGFLLQHAELPEACIELVFCVLAHAARVDDDHVRVAIVGRGLISRLVEQPRHTLRIVDVHLAAERFDQVLFRHRLSLSPFAFCLPFASMPSISLALARTGSVTVLPRIMRLISSIRPAASRR
jgi:hypothetical protein